MVPPSAAHDTIGAAPATVAVKFTVPFVATTVRNGATVTETTVTVTVAVVEVPAALVMVSV